MQNCFDSLSYTFQTSALGMELIPFYISNLEVMNVEIET